MWFVLAGPISHVPRPPTSATMPVTAAVRMRPLSAIIPPRIRNGTVLPIRWPQPACRNGAKTMSGSVSASRGWMPLESRLRPATSSTSTTHMTATIAPTNAKPRTRSSEGDREVRGPSTLVAIVPEGYAPWLKRSKREGRPVGRPFEMRLC